jgi:hypothetical protein
MRPKLHLKFFFEKIELWWQSRPGTAAAADRTAASSATRGGEISPFGRNVSGVGRNFVLRPKFAQVSSKFWRLFVQEFPKF